MIKTTPKKINKIIKSTTKTTKIVKLRKIKITTKINIVPHKREYIID